MDPKLTGAIVAVLALLAVYIFLGVKNKSWNPMKKKFWTGTPDKVEECPPGKVMIDSNGVLIACNAKEGFTVFPSSTKPGVWFQTPVAERVETNQAFLQNLLQCDMPADKEGLYCDVNKPMVFWFNKSVFVKTLKYWSNPNRTGGNPEEEATVADLEAKPGNYLKIDTYESLQTMWNGMHDAYNELNATEKENLKARFHSDGGLRFQVVWEGKVRLRMLTKEDPQNVWVDAYPGDTIPWGLFVMLAGMVEISKGTWRELVLHKDLSGPIKEPNHGVMLYRTEKIFKD